jgi:hypothetical protein
MRRAAAARAPGLARRRMPGRPPRQGAPVLYCYALLDRAPPGPRPRGLRGEPVRIIRGPGFVVAAGALEAAPGLSAAALRRHDAAVRRLFARARALLPFRFGAIVSGPAELAERLRPIRGPVRRALRLVAGREQMTLRIAYPRRRPRAAPAPGPPALGPGARYLHARAGRDAGTAPGALAPIRAVLAELVAAEHVEPHRAAGARGASVYHLIPRGRAPDYRRALRVALHRPGGPVVSVSGPWPPYAFAAGLLA